MLDSNLVEEIDRRPVPGIAYPIAAVIGPHQSHASLIIGGKRSPVGPLPPRLIPKPDAFALGPASTGNQKASNQGNVLTAVRERAREREAESAPFRIRFAEVAPLSGRGVLLGQSIQYHLAGWVLRVVLDSINTDFALLTGAVTKQ